MNIAESAEKVRDYMTKHKFSFRALLDSDSRVSGLYGIRGTPTRFLIDRRGNVLAGSIGPRDWANEEARKLIATLLRPDGKRL